MVSSRPFVLGVGGSPRKGGNSDALLKQVLGGAVERGADTQAVRLFDLQFQGCIGCEQCRKTGVCTGLEDDLTPLFPQVLKAKGLVLVSPTHNYNITAWMKAFIDRLYCFYEFGEDRPRSWSSRLAGQGRKAVIGAICEQEDATDMGFTLEAMRRPLEALGYEVVDELSVFAVFDKGKVKEDEDVMSEAKRLGGELAQSLAGGG